MRMLERILPASMLSDCTPVQIKITLDTLVNVLLEHFTIHRVLTLRMLMQLRQRAGEILGRVKTLTNATSILAVPFFQIWFMYVAYIFCYMLVYMYPHIAIYIYIYTYIFLQK